MAGCTVGDNLHTPEALITCAPVALLAYTAIVVRLRVVIVGGVAEEANGRIEAYAASSYGAGRVVVLGVGIGMGYYE